MESDKLLSSPDFLKLGNNPFQQKKTKVLMLSDHPLSTSGVGTQARWLINGLLSTGRYTFRCFGGAVKHEDYRTIVVNDDFIIKPVDGFGNRDMLRQTLAIEKPDVLLIFNDPRFFIWVWEMEDEIHQICPIAYWHLWDNAPWPEFNRVLYESTDLVNCINYPTYEMVHERFPEKTNFIPHALPQEVFRPLSDEDRKKHKLNILGSQRENDFVAIWVSRNARRKMPSDVIVSWSMFIKELEKTYGHTRATLIMHTDPNDHEGPNLHHVLDITGMKKNVVFSNQRFSFEEMNVLYNVSDVVLSRSCAEGFGLSTLEAMQAGLPAIGLKTGGQTRQLVNHNTGEQYGIALDPEVKSLVGTQTIPYIYEDYISHETFANSIMKMYKIHPDDRRLIGERARKYVLEEFNITKMVDDWDKSLITLSQRQKKSKWSVKPL